MEAIDSMQLVQTLDQMRLEVIRIREKVVALQNELAALRARLDNEYEQRIRLVSEIDAAHALLEKARLDVFLEVADMVEKQPAINSAAFVRPESENTEMTRTDGLIPGEVELLRAELAALRARLEKAEKLATYAEHRINCEKLIDPFRRECTCGFAEAWNAMIPAYRASAAPKAGDGVCE